MGEGEGLAENAALGHGGLGDARSRWNAWRTSRLRPLYLLLLGEHVLVQDFTLVGNHVLSGLVVAFS